MAGIVYLRPIREERGEYTYVFSRDGEKVEIRAPDSASALAEFLHSSGYTVLGILDVTHDEFVGDPFSLAEKVREKFSGADVVFVDYTRGPREAAVRIVSATRVLERLVRTRMTFYYAGMKADPEGKTYVAQISEQHAAPVLVDAFLGLNPVFLEYSFDLRRRLVSECREGTDVIAGARKAVGYVTCLFRALLFGTSIEECGSSNRAEHVRALRDCGNALTGDFAETCNTLANLLEHLDGLASTDELRQVYFYYIYGHYGLFVLFTTELLKKKLRGMLKEELSREEKIVAVQFFSSGKAARGEEVEEALRKYVVPEFHSKARDIVSVLPRLSAVRNVVAHGADPNERRRAESLQREINELWTRVERVFLSLQ